MSTKAIWAIWAGLLLAAAALLVQRLHVTADLTAFLPASTTAAERLLVAQLRDGIAARLILIGIEGDDPDRAARSSRALADALQGEAAFELVANGEARRMQADRDALFAARYLLSPAVTAERFSEAGLRAAIARSAELFASPAGALIRPTLPRDPTGEFPALLAARFGQDAAAVHGGVWYDTVHRRAVLLAQTRAAGYDMDAQLAAQAAIRRAFAATGSAGADRLLLSGPSVFAVDSRAAIERDANRLTIAASLGVIVILALAYRSAALVALSLVPVATGFLCALAAVAWAFDPVHAITLGFGVTLIGEAVDYPTYLFVNRAAGDSVATAAQRIWPTLRLAVGTTVVGSLAMLLSSFAGLSQLGLFTLVGVLAAGLTTRYLLPRMVGSTAAVRIEGDDRLAILLARATRRLGALHLLVPVLLAGAATVVLPKGDALFERDLSAFNPIDPHAQRVDQELRDAIGAPDVRTLLVIEGDSREQVLERSEALQPELQKLVEQRLIRGFDSPSRYLPSAAVQRARQLALPDAAALRPALAKALADSPFRDDMFEPFIVEVAQARARRLLEPADFEGTAWGQALAGLLVRQDGRWLGLMPLQGAVDPRELASALRKLASPGLALVDLKGDAERLISRYLVQSLQLAGLGVLLIAAVMALGLRRVGPAVSALIPVLTAVALTVAILTLAGVRLTLLHVVALLLVLGIGVNYALFFMQASSERLAHARGIYSALVACATTTLAFGVLCLSQAGVLRAIGSTVAIGAVCSWLLSAAWFGQRNAPPGLAAR